MKQRIHTEKFNTGNYAQKESTEPIDKFSNRSQMKGSGGIQDPLKAALGHRPQILPRDNHNWSHSKQSRPRGALYSPAQSYGALSRTGAGKGVYGYGGNVRSATPGNAVGSPPNRRGDNAVGHAPNRSGSNAVGYPPHRRGTNAIGNPPNRYGENALSGRFVPKGGGGHP